MKPARLKAVCLISGGLDSATSTAVAASEGYEIYALTLDYGQRHLREIDSARKVAASLGASAHEVLSVDLSRWGGSALTAGIDIPQDRNSAEMAADIPPTYVPARNTVFLSLAMAWAEVLGAQAIYIGVNQLDYSGYPDCRREYIEAFEQLAALATRAGVLGQKLTIHAPLISLTKAQIIRLGAQLGVDYSLTWSCYLGADRPCGRCDSCVLRAKGFEEAGLPDPALQGRPIP